MSRRISGYRTIDKKNVQTQAGNFELRIYMGKTGTYRTTTKFIVVCDDFDIEESGENLDEITEAAEKLVRERAVVSWEPYLYVTVDGSSALEAPDEGDPEYDEDEEDRSERLDSNLFLGKDVDTACIQLDISVKPLELSREPKKQHRWQSNQIDDGWPEVGFPEPDPDARSYGWRQDRSMRALVADTPENRQAFENLRDGMRIALRKLEEMLSPDCIEQSLRTLRVTPMFTLPAPPRPTSKSKRSRKKKPH